MIEHIVSDMADVFEDNLIPMEGAYVSQEGMSSLTDMFNTVPIALRAVVYSAFLEELNVRGIVYEAEQFKGN